MKKKLFAVAVVISFYVLFVFAFTGSYNQTDVTQFLPDAALSKATLEIAPIDRAGSDPTIVSASFRDPMPPPLKKPKPRRKKRDKR